MTTPISADDYSDDSFWAKVKGFAMAAGREVIDKALCLYFTAREPATPVWAKTAIFGALAYFISPLDAIPDVIPVVGYTDDLGVLVAALATVNSYITDEVRARAAAQLRTWFD